MGRVCGLTNEKDRTFIRIVLSFFPFLLDSNLQFIIMIWIELICAFYRKRLTNFELIIMFSQIQLNYT